MITEIMKKIKITSPTLITEEIVRLIAHLSPESAALLLSGLSGGDITPELLGLIDRLRAEQIWALFLKFYDKRNKFMIDEFERLMSEQSDDDILRM